VEAILANFAPKPRPEAL